MSRRPARPLAVALATLIAAASVTLSPAAHADPDTCRANGSRWYSQTGQQCRGDDLNQWHIGNSPQLYCWWYATDPMCQNR